MYFFVGIMYNQNCVKVINFVRGTAMKNSFKIIISAVVAVILIAVIIVLSIVSKNQAVDPAESSTLPSTEPSTVPNVTESQTWFDWNAYISELELSSTDPSASDVSGSDLSSNPSGVYPVASSEGVQVSVSYVYVDPFNGQVFGSTEAPATVPQTTSKPEMTEANKPDENEMIEYTYTVDDSKKTVTLDRYTGNDSTVKVPDTVNGLPVAKIGSNCFNGKSLECVYISKNVKTISGKAFYNCKKLEIVYFMGSGEVAIGDSVFEDCTSLSKVYLSKNTTSIGDCCFAGCTALKSIYIPDSVKTIGNLPFNNCSKELVIKCEEASVAHQTALKYDLKYELT